MERLGAGFGGRGAGGGPGQVRDEHPACHLADVPFQQQHCIVLDAGASSPCDKRSLVAQDSFQVDTAEQVYISSLALLKMLKHGSSPALCMRRCGALRTVALQGTLERRYAGERTLLPRAGRAGVPMEVMGLMLGEFVDDYTVNTGLPRHELCLATVDEQAASFALRLYGRRELRDCPVQLLAERSRVSLKRC